ncbi:hypothetical protein LJC52_05415 [Bacteroidales bacterium OttesenSCG-928-A17]|nr:hypothetical protein [Bacteroidales bacterium OttesenSCG-928-A17]
MDPISIATGVIGLGASLFGGSKAAKQRNKMNNYLNQRDSENNAWYNANYYSDYTQRADSQALLKQLRDNMDRYTKIANNTAVVTGATPEAQAVSKEQANKTVSDTLSTLGSIGQQYKDRVTDRYLSHKSNLANLRMGMMEGSANSYENLMSNGLNTLSGSLGGLLSGTTIKNTPANINQKLPVDIAPVDSPYTFSNPATLPNPLK